MASRFQAAESIGPGSHHLFFVANMLAQLAGLYSEQPSVELHTEVLA